MLNRCHGWLHLIHNQKQNTDSDNHKKKKKKKKTEKEALKSELKSFVGNVFFFFLPWNSWQIPAGMTHWAE